MKKYFSLGNNIPFFNWYFKNLFALLFIFGFQLALQAQFVHPGITNKKSDLDRVKYMVEAQIDPWYSSYQEMASDAKSSYNYSVRGDQSFTVLGRDDGTNYSAWNNDIRAAYYNAIMWYVTGDSRHADKSIEIFNAWNNLQDVTSGGTQALSGGIAYIMVEAAEIIKSTYDGWSANDIQDFKDMLVYPGYSNTQEPNGITRTSGSFYWQAYQGDSVRHGNQGLSGFRAVMAMGIFLDNEIMYDRALRYIQGLSHRSDDIPYPAGPPQATTISSEGLYEDTYNYIVGNSIEDFGYNEVMTNYIYENGQCQESSRDQQHTVFGIGNLCAMAEMAWNQGDDLYSHADDRLLLGLEYTTKYNVSYLQSYPDQEDWWIPTVASREFIQRFNASQRVYAKEISPTHVGGFIDLRPVFEMPLAHYQGRGFKTADEVKWTTRARDISIEASGYEAAGHQNGAIGWGALTSRRPEGCYGEPINGFDSNGLPEFSMNILPGTIEAENFDYSPVSGEDRTYNETTISNQGGEYRSDEAVDIQSSTGGGYNVGWISDGEWLTYTIYVPETRTYDISASYAALHATGKIKFEFSGTDKTGEVALPSTGGTQIWEDYTVASRVTLSKGVQSMKVLFSGTSSSFNLNSITISEEDNNPVSTFIPDPNKTYYIDATIHNVRLAATGENEDAYTTDITTTGADVEWKFVDKGNGYWHIQRAEGGTKPRLRTDVSENADMQETTSSGTYTYYEITTGDITDSYFLTLPNGPASYNRLQIDRDLEVKMVSSADHNGTWESFTITEVENETVTETFLEAEDYDGMSGIQTEVSSENGENVGYINNNDWLRFDAVNLSGISNINARVASRFTGGTIEIRTDSITGTLIGSIAVSNTGGDQNWTTLNTSISNASGTEDVYLVFTGGNGFLFNINWIEFNTSLESNKEVTTETKLLDLSHITTYPNPSGNQLTVELSNNYDEETTITLYNVNGKKVLQTKPNANEVELDVSKLHSGLYFLSVENKSETFTKKIIKL